MPRYIIECDDPTDIILGMKAIKSAIRDNNRLAFVEFTDGSLWVVKKTKTGYSARTRSEATNA
jgi:hypothetical protein